MTHSSPSGGHLSITVRSGHLADGTEYRIGLPPDWNGTVINDLDAAMHLDSMSDQAAFLLSNRFAYSGTSRRPIAATDSTPATGWPPTPESLDRIADLGEPEFPSFTTGDFRSRSPLPGGLSTRP
jgi:hypothetical protein